MIDLTRFDPVWDETRLRDSAEPGAAAGQCPAGAPGGAERVALGPQRGTGAVPWFQYLPLLTYRQGWTLCRHGRLRLRGVNLDELSLARRTIQPRWMACGVSRERR